MLLFNGGSYQNECFFYLSTCPYRERFFLDSRTPPDRKRLFLDSEDISDFSVSRSKALRKFGSERREGPTKFDYLCICRWILRVKRKKACVPFLINDNRFPLKSYGGPCLVKAPLESLGHNFTRTVENNGSVTAVLLLISDWRKPEQKIWRNERATEWKRKEEIDRELRRRFFIMHRGISALFE